MSRAAAPPSLLPASWRVQLPVFEGPLDLLLHLIKINEVDITDIPVALVCDQFHEYLMLADELDLDLAGEYIYEAALLIQLKSRTLLPHQRDEAGREIEEDPRQELVARLLEYRRLKEAAQTLAEVDRLRQGIWTRRATPPETSSEAEDFDLADVSLFELLQTFKKVLDRYDREHPEALHLRGETFAVRGQIERLLASLRPGSPRDLLDDLMTLSCRAEVVAAFLALLEVVRLGLVRVHKTAKGEFLLYRTTREALARELEAIEG
jgi:segregation and condensation protein A